MMTKLERIGGNMWALREPDPKAPGYDRSVATVEIEGARAFLTGSSYRPLTDDEMDRVVSLCREHGAVLV